MALGLFTLTGSYLAYGDTPASGTVQIDGIPQIIVDTAGNKIKVGPKKVTLDVNGSFSIQLPTDSTSGNSTVQGYRVTARLKHQNVDPIEFYAPAANAVLKMSAVTPSVVAPVSPFIGPAGPAGAPGPAGPTGAASTVPGPAGPQGLPGVNAVANDTATAGYVAGPSATKTALDSKYGPRFDVVIDLCSAPYNLSPGQDATTALQAALDAAAADGRSTDIVFSKGGNYTINGPQQTGSYLMTAGANAGNSYTYSGQVLLPAVPVTASQAIRIRGAAPAVHGGSGRPYNGTTLTSNATSGWVFDTKPSFENYTAYNPWSNLMPIFQDLILVVPTNPQCGGINALVCQSLICDSFYVRAATVGNFLTPGYTLTGTKEAISCPQGLNAGTVNLRRVDIRNVPKGIRMTEHIVIDHVRISFANAALVCDRPGGHANTFIQLDIEDCLTFIDYEGTFTGGIPLTVSGDVDFEGQSGAGYFVKMPQTNKIRGLLNLRLTDPGTLPNKVGTGTGNGARLGNLNLSLLDQGGVPWMTSWPNETFQRYVQIPAATITEPGFAYPSAHPWWTNTGTLVVDPTTQTVMSTNGTSRTSALIQNNLANGRARVITGKFRFGTGYSAGLIGNFIPAGTNANSYVGIRAVSSGNLQVIGSMGDGSNFVETSVAVGSLNDGADHNLSLLILVDPMGIPTQAIGYLDGTQVVSYTLTATNRAALTPDTATSTNAPFVADGFQFFDATTALKTFAVTPAPSLSTPGPPGPGGVGTLDQFDYWSTLGNGRPAIGSLGTAAITTTANTRIDVPIKAPRSGTVTGLSWLQGTVVTGNYDIALLDTAGNILWAKGSTAMGATANVIVNEVVSPGVTVAGGDTFYVSFVCSQPGITIKGLNPGVAGMGLLADGVTSFARQKTSAGPPIVSGGLGTSAGSSIPWVRLNVT